MCLCVVARGKSGRAGGGGAPARRRHHETEGVHVKVRRLSWQRTIHGGPDYGPIGLVYAEVDVAL